MKIIEFLTAEQPVYSLEFFPPRNGEPLDSVFNTMDALIEFEPSFISVTGGALGSQRGGTIALVAAIKRKYGIEGVVHLTCVNKSRQDMENLLMEIKYNGIENILALRGDPPRGAEKFIPHPQGHSYASGLVEQIRQLNSGQYIGIKENTSYQGVPTDFCVSAAGYPDGHPECPDWKQCLKYLKIKVDSGADYIVSQMVFDADVFLRFRDEALNIGITKPIIPGIMPVTKYAQINFVLNQPQICITIPAGYRTLLENHKDDAEYITKLCRDHDLALAEKLLTAGVPGIHFFTMNRPEPTAAILRHLVK